MQGWPEPVERVARALREAAVDARLEELPGGTATLGAAARALGCSPGQIVQTLVYVCDRRYVVVLAPGDREPDPGRVAGACGAGRARLADAEGVLAATGFEPGGVAPFPLAAAERVLLDRPLLLHELVWVGAGSARHVAALAPADLARLTRADPADLSG